MHKTALFLKIGRVLCSVLLVFAAITAGETPAVSAFEPSDIAARIDEILCVKTESVGAADLQLFLDGDLTAGAGDTAEWYVIALRQYGCLLDYSTYADALESYLPNAAGDAAVTKLRYALALIAAGRGNSAYISEAVADAVGAQGIMSWVFGLHLINSGVTSAYSAEEVIGVLLARQSSDGGWSLTGERAEADVTAMTLQALAPYYEADKEVTAAADAALACLSSLQQPSGGFLSYGAENAESAAQVIIALTSLGIDPRTDARFVKKGNSVFDALLQYRLADGTYAHLMGEASDSTAAVQALCAFVSLWRMEQGMEPFFTLCVPVESESIFSAQPVSDISSNRVPLKVILYVFVCGVAALLYLALLLRGRGGCKNLLFCVCLALVLSVAVFLLDFQSTNEYYSTTPSAREKIGTVTLSIRCDTIAEKTAQSVYIPADGAILPTVTLPIYEGSTVYDVLLAASKEYVIHFESRSKGYIVGIGYIYAFDFGDLSGWVYRVNGETPSLGCDEYVLADGDEIEWLYTCAGGHDLP